MNSPLVIDVKIAHVALPIGYVWQFGSCLSQTRLKINHTVPYTNLFMARNEITPIVQIVLTQWGVLIHIHSEGWL